MISKAWLCTGFPLPPSYHTIGIICNDDNYNAN